jgi:hypothetical protein
MIALVSERVPLKQGLKRAFPRCPGQHIKGFRESSIKTRIETIILTID